MTDKQKLDLMANRGTPTGPIALLDRVQAPPTATHPSMDRRFRGLAVAAATFVVVLIGGLLLGWFQTPLDFITQTESSVEWMEMTETDGSVSVGAGPGGMLRITHSDTSNGPIFEFSHDARSWAPIDLQFDEGWGNREVVSTSDTWLIIGTDGRMIEARSSSDGISWSEVALPDPLRDALVGIHGSPGGFLATAYDAFGVGSTVWWSRDGSDWSEVTGMFPVDPRQGGLYSSAGGIVIRPGSFFPDPFPVEMYLSVDSTSWTRTSIRASGEDGVGSEIAMQLVDFVGGQWIAIGQVYPVDRDPELVAWTSVDGNDWIRQGVLPFGTEPGHAVSLAWEYSIVADSLVVLPWTMPVQGGPGEIRTMNGDFSGTGELWMTSDGRTWHRELSISGTISGYAATVTGDGSLAGVWTRLPAEIAKNDDPDDNVALPTTTRFEPDPADLDPVGLALQDTILADGTVTRAEFEQAAEGWKLCMQSLGWTEASFEIHPSGGWSRGWSADPNAGEQEDAFCEASYVARVLDGLGR